MRRQSDIGPKGNIGARKRINNTHENRGSDGNCEHPYGRTRRILLRRSRGIRIPSALPNVFVSSFSFHCLWPFYLFHCRCKHRVFRQHCSNDRNFPLRNSQDLSQAFKTKYYRRRFSARPSSSAPLKSPAQSLFIHQRGFYTLSKAAIARCAMVLVWDGMDFSGPGCLRFRERPNGPIGRRRLR